MCYIRNTGCCAINEIGSLSSHPNAKAAMTSFCQAVFPRSLTYYDDQGRYYPAPKEGPERDNLYSTYIFTGVVKFTRTRGGNVTYGPNFKAFIKKHNLGTVVESQGRPNRKNHPDHIVKAWVWSVNIRSMKAWWKKNNPAPFKKPEKKVKVPVLAPAI